MQLGSSTRALRTRLGHPAEIVERGGFSVYLYGGFGLWVYLRQDTVAAVATSNSLFRIGGSLGIGHPASDVQAAFGSATGQGTLAGLRSDLYNDRGIGFTIDRGAIATIIVFRPGEAPLISTL